MDTIQSIASKLHSHEIDLLRSIARELLVMGSPVNIDDLNKEIKDISEQIDKINEDRRVNLGPCVSAFELAESIDEKLKRQQNKDPILVILKSVLLKAAEQMKSENSKSKPDELLEKKKELRDKRNKLLEYKEIGYCLLNIIEELEE